ncbi:helix-hairpin-helix domain-containing protein [Archangium violaceum]|uniref:helix-hairpin-helix domain-containing protein n=1 Tax=Archangium violaceum TaxID=83451 RepID=UPI0037BF3832
MSSLVSFVQGARAVRRAYLLALLMTGFLLVAPDARAEPYEVELSIQDETDLRALFEDGVLSEADFETLRELLRTGVELRTASREALYALPGLTWAQVDALLTYRERVGGSFAPEDLVEVGVLTDEALRRLRPFLSEVRGEGTLSGRVRLLSAYGAADALVPPVLLQARVDGPLGLRGGGVLSLTRRRLDAVRYDVRRRALVAELPRAALQVPKLHVRWEGEHASVLVGTYRLGFGQRLTLDTTGQPAPDGFVPDDGFRAPGGSERRCMLTGTGACLDASEQGRVTPDFGWTEGFRGVVGTVHGQVEGVALSFTGFGSYQSRDLSQYELFDTKTREAPDVLAVLPGTQVPGAARFVSRTLPDVFHELAGGGHVTVGFSPRARLGLTGWGAWPVWAVEGVSLDFKESARYPGGGAPGAVGVDAAWGAGPVDLFFEGARGFSGSSGAGGGFGAVQRTVLGDKRRELELTLRYYGRDFDNPYSRAVSGPDESEGLRASNELGARLRYLHRTADGAWRLAGRVDVWTQPPGSELSGVAHLGTSARVDFVGVPELQPSVWVEHRNKDLGQNGPGLCFAGDATCVGEQYRFAGRVRFAPVESLALAVQLQHTWVGTRQRPESFQQDGRALLDVLFRPLPSLRLHGRASWQDEDLSENTRLTQTLRTSLEVAWALERGPGLRARYELALDLKSPVGSRTPPELPQHLFRLELEGRFPWSRP